MGRPYAAATGFTEFYHFLPNFTGYRFFPAIGRTLQFAKWEERQRCSDRPTLGFYRILPNFTGYQIFSGHRADAVRVES